MTGASERTVLPSAARLADATGLDSARARELLRGARSTPTERLAIRNAFGDDALSALNAEAAPVAREPQPMTTPRPKRAVTPARLQRIAEWSPKVEASGMTLSAIAAAAKLTARRVQRIVRAGALPRGDERKQIETAIARGAPKSPRV